MYVIRFFRCLFPNNLFVFNCPNPRPREEVLFVRLFLTVHQRRVMITPGSSILSLRMIPNARSYERGNYSPADHSYVPSAIQKRRTHTL